MSWKKKEGKKRLFFSFSRERERERVFMESWIKRRESHLLVLLFLLLNTICFMFPCVRMEMEIQQIFRHIHINFIIVDDSSSSQLKN
jgi:hypothetical protein